MILLGLWSIPQIIYILPNNHYSSSLIYTFAMGISLYCIKQPTAKITLLITLFSIGSEFFWWETDYVNKPQIYYYVGLLAVIESARELLFKRVFILSTYFGFLSVKIALDWQIRGVLLTYNILVILMLLEYFVRHLTAYVNVTTVYYNYSLIAAITSGITLALIYMHYFYNQAKKHLTA
ncbi:MAG: hypothetical protein ACJAV1_000873 [Paraglaciecola sp.]